MCKEICITCQIYEPSPDIFHKYTELGEKVPRQVRRPMLSSRGSAHGITQLGHTLTVIEQVCQGHTPPLHVPVSYLPGVRTVHDSSRIRGVMHSEVSWPYCPMQCCVWVSV